MAESTTARSLAFTDYAPGDVIAEKYKLERVLGQGAQGAIWLAENLALGSDVAIKLVRGDTENPASTLRLEKEARAAARVVHPAVVRVFDLGQTANGDGFIVMEYLEGENLGQRLDLRRRLSAIEAVRTLLPIADVLHVAHTRGIVHRDLKPENVFLAKDGTSIQPKLLDFGIAKLGRGTQTGRPITQVGMLIGSPGYLSPEQASCCADVGPAADVWSFSVVLYECVTGSLPFAGTDYGEMLQRIGQDEPQPLVAHGIHELELWEILRRGLSKSPDERWPNMQVFGQELAKWLRSRGVRDDVSGVLLEARWLRKRETPVAWNDGAEPSSSVRPVRRLPPESNGRTKNRRLGRTIALGAAAATLLVALGAFSAANEASESSAGGEAAPPEANPAPRTPTPAPRPADVGATRTVSVSEPPRGVSTQAPAATRDAMPDGGVPKRRVRRVPNDLLNPY